MRIIGFSISSFMITQKEGPWSHYESLVLFFIGYIFSQPLFDNSGQYVVENAKKCYGNIE